MTKFEKRPSTLSARAEEKKRRMFGSSGNLNQVFEVEVIKVHPNPDQPRKVFDEERLKELAETIKLHGQQVPILVSDHPQKPGEFLIVGGERRYRAISSLEQPFIIAMYTSGDPDEIALIDNIQREDLNPLEQAEALSKYKAKTGKTDQELAETFGKSRVTITELLTLAKLPQAVKDASRTSDMPSKSVLLQVARQEDEAAQLALWKELKASKPTVKQAREKRGKAEGGPSETDKTLMQFEGGMKRLRKLASDHVTVDDTKGEAFMALYQEFSELLNQLQIKARSRERSLPYREDESKPDAAAE